MADAAAAPLPAQPNGGSGSPPISAPSGSGRQPSAQNAGADSGATNKDETAVTPRPESSTYLLNDPKLKEILLSDVGVEALLARLKQSVFTMKEFATYIKKMATIEAEHSAHLKKTSRTMTDMFKRPEIKKGTCQNQVLNILKSTDRYGDAGNTFIDSMHRMHDELMDVVRSIERQRKTTKETALRHEKALIDAEREAEKAKSKYDSTCEELDRARAGDPSKKLAFKSKSEEELHRRMTIAEVDYQQKVDVCQRTRRELVEKLRVESIRTLQGLVLECDNALSLQVLRFSNLFETLQLNRGFVIAPIKPRNSPTANLALKEMALKIDSELDFYNYVWGIPKTKPVLNRSPVAFKKHPTMGGSKPSKPPQQAPKPSRPGATTGSIPPPSAGGSRSTSGQSSQTVIGTPGLGSTAGATDRTVSGASTLTSGSVPPPSKMISSGTAKTGPVLGKMSNSNYSSTSVPTKVVPPVAAVPAAASPTAAAAATAPSSLSAPEVPSSQPAAPTPSAGPAATDSAPEKQESENYDPSKHGLPVYGTPLEDLLDYEEGTVPRVVYQCVQAIDNFGLEVEGIYRANGNNTQVQEIRREFDIDAAAVDLLRPNNGVNDIHSVASALKQYFQALPDPLLTREFHRELVNAANIKDDVRRRDTIHAIINKLPDPNYTTLRYLIFHLFRVQERESVNRMSVTNLGIVWGPVLMDTDYLNVGEMAVQSRVIETILINAYAIFEAE